MAKVERLKIYYLGHDISDDIELREKKSNPFGWSTAKVFYMEDWIGSLICGYPEFSDSEHYKASDFSWDIVDDGTGEILESSKPTERVTNSDND